MSLCVYILVFIYYIFVASTSHSHMLAILLRSMSCECVIPSSLTKALETMEQDMASYHAIFVDITVDFNMVRRDERWEPSSRGESNSSIVDYYISTLSNNFIISITMQC